VVRAQMGGTDTGSGRAREVSAELEKRSGRRAEGLLFSMQLSGVRAAPERRVFTTTAPAAGPGSALVQTTVSPTIIDRLREKIVVRALGATVLTGLIGNLSIPRLKASATGYWVAENTPITASDPQTDQVALTPKHVGGLVEVSRNMILQPSLDVTTLFENDLAQIIAVALDQAAIQGGGTSQPVGLLAGASGIGSVALGVAGAAPTWASVISLIAAIDTANALGGSLAFATNAKAVAKMRQTLKTSVDTSSNFLMTDANTLAGYPLASTQNVPSNLVKGASGAVCSALIFGDWSQLVLGFWSELDILVNPFESTAYPKGNVQVRAMATADVELRHPLAFAAISDMLTT
jgi:HK97 family phage major capsid protein